MATATRPSTRFRSGGPEHGASSELEVLTSQVPVEHREPIDGHRKGKERMQTWAEGEIDEGRVEHHLTW